MNESLRCYRCGESLASLTPPLSRQDECPKCANYLHVCRMCVFFDPRVPTQCREDGAEEVIEKERVNFCDWFKPSATAFIAERKSSEDLARAELGALFGETPADAENSDVAGRDATSSVEDLFK